MTRGSESRGCVMFSTNWVSRSPHRALTASHIYRCAYTHRRGRWLRCRGVPTALLLTQPRASVCTWPGAATLNRATTCDDIASIWISVFCLSVFLSFSILLKARVVSPTRARLVLANLNLSRFSDSRFMRARAQVPKKISVLPDTFAECVLRHSP